MRNKARMWAGIHFVRCLLISAGCLLVLGGAATAGWSGETGIRFAILGDRTGEAMPGVYEQVLRETAGDHPQFILNVGDSIQGGQDATAEIEWRQFERLLAPYARFRIFPTPGNHDIWSDASAAAYMHFTKHPLHYSFDYGPMHITVLDNSRSDELAASELAFLEEDLAKNHARPVKIVVSHRPSWLLQAVLGSSRFPLQQTAKRYGVSWIIAGHVHQMLHKEVDGIQYISVPSSGGHLRASRKYEDGWFFAHSILRVEGNSVRWEIKETGEPFGKGRVTTPGDWGIAGLIQRKSSSS